LACSSCSVMCESCGEEFCARCSMINYGTSFGRVLCLECDRAGK
jgi:hypothetical protein